MPSKLAIKKISLSAISITDEMLYGLENLEKVSISKKVKTLPKGAFYKKNKLNKIFIEHEIDLRKIPEFCFSFCTSLTQFIIPDSVVSIEEKAFCNCTSISQIEIKSNVTYIHQTAFDGWKEDQRIYVYRKYDLSEKCRARIIDISEDIIKQDRIVTKERDLTLKKYIVEAKGGHVGRMYYMPVRLPIEATSKKEAARIARDTPRIKHHHEDAILSVVAVTDKAFYEQVKINKADPYLQIKNSSEKKEFEDVINSRVLDDKRNQLRKSHSKKHL